MQDPSVLAFYTAAAVPIKKKRPSTRWLLSATGPTGLRLQVTPPGFAWTMGSLGCIGLRIVSSRPCGAASVPDLDQEHTAATLLEGHGR